MPQPAGEERRVSMTEDGHPGVWAHTTSGPYCDCAGGGVAACSLACSVSTSLQRTRFSSSPLGFLHPKLKLREVLRLAGTVVRLLKKRA